MIIKINKNPSRIISIGILAVAFLTKINGIPVMWYYPFLVCSPLYFFLLIRYRENIDQKEMNVSRVVFWLAVIPYIIAVGYSFIIRSIENDTLDSGLRAISVTGQKILTVGLAVLLFSYFHDDVMEVLIDSAILSYLITIIMAFSNIGINGFFDYLKTMMYKETIINGWFEMHDLGLSIGMCILYKLMLAKNKDVGKIILMIIIFFLCWKRIAFLAIIASILVWIFTKHSLETLKNFQISLLMIGVLIGSFLYVMLISTGALYVIASNIGIDISNRRFLYKYALQLYEWSYTFLGHGLGYTGKYFTQISGTSASAATANLRAVHNDILKTYIDLGFVGSLLWFGWYTWQFPRKLSEHVGNMARYAYCIVTIYAYIVYATDNTSDYFIFQLIMHSFILYSSYKDFDIFHSVILKPTRE